MLTVCNHFPEPIWVCLMMYHPNCPDGGNWLKAGWWRVESGQCQAILGGDLDDLNRYYGLFAQTQDGVTKWFGDYTRPVPHEPFVWCEWTSSSDSVNVGFFLIDVGDSHDYIANFLPS
jgi:uncharacterized membrane protein